MAKGIDWDLIRSEYEETPKSERLIAEEHGIAHGTIQTRRRKDKKAGDEWIRKNHVDIVKDKALINSRKPILNQTGLRKIEEIKLELGENYSVLDEPLVIAFALNYQKWVDVQYELVGKSSIAESSKGTEYISPYESLAKMYESAFIKIAGQLGLSLASRKRMKLNPKSDTEEASLFDIVDELGECDVDV